MDIEFQEQQKQQHCSSRLKTASLKMYDTKIFKMRLQNKQHKPQKTNANLMRYNAFLLKQLNEKFKINKNKSIYSNK
jgi:hypothetical protein